MAVTFLQVSWFTFRDSGACGPVRRGACQRAVSGVRPNIDADGDHGDDRADAQDALPQPGAEDRLERRPRRPVDDVGVEVSTTSLCV